MLVLTPSMLISSAISIAGVGDPGAAESLAFAMGNVAEKTSDMVVNFNRNNFDHNFEIPDNTNPLIILSTIAFVTASDMIPFVPCQPLAISLGAKYGLWAFPVCVTGQTLAGILAFQSSRRISDSERIQEAFEALGNDGNQRFREFRESVLGGDKNDSNNNNNNDRDDGDSTTLLLDDNDNINSKPGADVDERTVFFALVGLRLAPFFPFSAGNYLLGGATSVGIRPFVLATVLGCMVSNAASVLVGMGGAELFLKQ